MANGPGPAYSSNGQDAWSGRRHYVRRQGSKSAAESPELSRASGQEAVQPDPGDTVTLGPGTGPLRRGKKRWRDGSSVSARASRHWLRGFGFGEPPEPCGSGGRQRSAPRIERTRRQASEATTRSAGSSPGGPRPLAGSRHALSRFKPHAACRRSIETHYQKVGQTNGNSLFGNSLLHIVNKSSTHV